VALVALVALFACNEVQENWEMITHTDTGTACLDATTADGNGEVTVRSDFCLSSSCSRNAVGSCEATLDGTTITITSQFEVEELTGDEVICTDDCGTIEANCGSVGPLAAGTYTMILGESTEEIEVPTTEGDCG